MLFGSGRYKKTSGLHSHEVSYTHQFIQKVNNIRMLCKYNKNSSDFTARGVPILIMNNYLY